MVSTQIDAPGELQRAGSLLVKNWTLAIPTALAALIVGILNVFVLATMVSGLALGSALGGRTGAGVGALASLPIALVIIVADVVVTIIAQAVVIVAAEDAWEGRAVDLGRSFATAVSRLVPLIGAYLVVLLIMIIPIALCFVLIGVPIILVVGFFLMFVTPAVVLGNEGGVAAVQSSYRMVRQNVMPSLIAFIGIVVAAIIAGILNAIFARMQILSIIVQFIVGGFLSAYVALVLARFYMLLRTQTALPFVAPPPPTPPPAAAG
jgi:hypothetical protein